MSSGVLTGDFATDKKTMDTLLRCGESFDLLRRELIIGGSDAVMYYIDGFVKAESLQKMLQYLASVESTGDGSPGSAARFAAEHIPAAEVDVENDLDALVTSVLSGCEVFLCDGFGPDALVIDMRTYPARSVDEPDNDRVIRGSRDGFVETMIFNAAMLRRRIRDPRLTIKFASVGSESRTDIAICYIDGVADASYVDMLYKKITSLDVKALPMGHRSLIESIIRQRWYNPFPKVRMTERPDAAAAMIFEGSVIILCDTSPEAMILPTCALDFLQETNDYYFPPLTGTYLRIVRHVIFWITVIASPLWYMSLMYQNYLPDALLFLVPEDPGNLPIILQLFLCEFALDGLKLASLNTPNILSNSLSVVGGLLLGDFAVKTGWLCPDVILYTAFVAIANFTQSSYELGYAFKFMRMLTLLLTALFGIYGFVFSVIGGFVLVATNKTVNGKRSYLYPLVPFNGKALAHLLFRLKKNDNG